VSGDVVKVAAPSATSRSVSVAAASAPGRCAAAVNDTHDTPTSFASWMTTASPDVKCAFVNAMVSGGQMTTAKVSGSPMIATDVSECA
jgi:hypothetical protein